MMMRPWTAISYNWKVGKSNKIMFNAPSDSESARQEFESRYPKEDLVALIPGIHDWATTYSLTNFAGSLSEDKKGT